LDCTFGAGGYTEHILKYTKAKVIAFDRDEKTVIKYVNNLKNIYKERFTFVADKFSTYNNHLKVMGISKVDAVELANIVRGVVGFKKKKNESKIDPSTKTFQALRIYVNDELNELNIALENSIDVLNKNGILAIVSFHSLEDRIVNHNQKVQNSVFNILSKKPILPSEEEIHINPESRSAKLRASKRL
ncbi:ribosomal RNA small subunit methyltransferase H-like, partial [Eupeodes corollae]|uniref:ribosomal RNA small subunit methyltransferase H-like n=1 Tax=Eupeodes corollae TaxID=290404 RepID=UPI0024936910